MKILLGTTNQDKLKILQEFFKNRKMEITPVKVSSEIPEQPLSKEATAKGSLNRARNAMKQRKADYAIGMEGGLELINGIYNLICAVTVIDEKGNKITTFSSPIPLPKKVSGEVKVGRKFGVVIREYAKNKNSDIVQELIKRRKSFLLALGKQAGFNALAL